ncbi:MAG: UTP--glucose-1-phosphate uridylyltransferase [Candidatus Magasanikbacteria bacterium CG_4_9_14_0_2_um_filter_42_11]|uniref:UTP--glucose-1-phosphate uridylyltransferase n=1 Tax=Candidatus Magasanikbacteria bacterium CG_4_9_14_0_2_um_filter_42_11 TaxID=1974643 RepID=A0A2M8F8Z3_9BACT|nr:MAG: UTP--glucose-1-phosphate uridylyltransferase [Candidatus Magasanikbacteria bacterium CG10_big_fil_rev_8_21_14_0_10_43_9]PIY92932.1 MAG: UTP--glucose-1-phosphate uridylyltransferase [Candidatus Magasanikbacteria bacterium CG_4_10_14_0_8_um_filter_42_12]PJC52203.1 MAG: UTP--glucose-1-phosphate uridylyltransferase [Candidatus Magasanikbacteria bacterium CG_4_9_14_0_2_um_filter_42_11]
MKQNVRKGVIIVAGLGTRFLPATKAMPKEMLPILDKPVVQYIVEEMVASGIKDIMFVTSWNKRSIEDHFDRNHDQEFFLKEQGKYERIAPLVELTKHVRFFYTRQSSPKGNGDALLCAKEFVGDEPFAFSDGDSVIDAKVPVIKQLLKIYDTKQASVIGAQRLTDKEEMTKYGNIYGKVTGEDRVYKVTKFEEKPDIEHVSPEGLIVGGMRYVFTKDIWPFLEKVRKGKDGELWVADAAHALAQKKKFFAYEYNGQYFDTGNKLALLKATLHFAMKDEEIRDEISAYL